jgi:hypothetical protein
LVLLYQRVSKKLQIDEDTNTTFWGDAICKEMDGNIIPALRILELDKKPPVGSKLIPCHIVFDEKMDFTRKARFVVGGHVTDPPTSQTYSSVVSRDIVWIAFFIAALNDLDILTSDVQGAYLNAPCKERVHTVCGDEFGREYKGRIAIIVKGIIWIKN